MGMAWIWVDMGPGWPQDTQRLPMWITMPIWAWGVWLALGGVCILLVCRVKGLLESIPVTFDSETGFALTIMASKESGFWVWVQNLRSQGLLLWSTILAIFLLKYLCLAAFIVRHMLRHSSEEQSDSLYRDQVSAQDLSHHPFKWTKVCEGIAWASHVSAKHLLMSVMIYVMSSVYALTPTNTWVGLYIIAVSYGFIAAIVQDRAIPVGPVGGWFYSHISEYRCDTACIFAWSQVKFDARQGYFD